MRLLTGREESEALKWLEEARLVGLASTCHRSKCGSIIVKNNEIIGAGYNSPPRDEKLKKCFKDEIPVNFKSDRTCCVHAEQRAVMDALKKNPDKIVGSAIYFARLEEKGRIKKSGRPYCTICSKMVLDAGIAEFVLWHEKEVWEREGIYVYDTREYNDLSFQYLEGV
ncbi:MAG: hypothetical protein GOU97_03485 [Nanoarchaeota archaeon]|nr:hypothetical protein [Nanoarchaeota archaeon]